MSLLELNLETKVLKPGARPRTAIERDRLERSEQEQEDSGEVTIAPREVTIEVVGIAPDDSDVSAFMEHLNNHPLFVAVGLEFIEQFLIEGNKMRRFRIVMQLNMDLTFDRDDESEMLRELNQNPMAEQRRFNNGGEPAPAPGVTNVPTDTD